MHPTSHHVIKRRIESVEQANRPYVRVVIDDIDTVIYDTEGVYDADLYDRYSTFEEARNATLCCIEDLLDEGDYEGPALKAGLESMLSLLEAAQSFEDLNIQAEYRRLVGWSVPAAA
jgi:hypothetical protein